MRRSVLYGVTIAVVALMIGIVIGQVFAAHDYADQVATAELHAAERLQLANAVDTQGQRINRAKELLQELSLVFDVPAPVNVPAPPATAALDKAVYTRRIDSPPKRQKERTPFLHLVSRM